MTVRDVLTTAHRRASREVTEYLGVDAGSGLTQVEADRRLAADGPNALTQARGERWWQVLLRQFASVVIWLLLAATAVAVFSHQLPEAFAILFVLLVNAALGFAIEWRAGRALEALRQSASLVARVRRDGCDRTVAAEELVAGDIVALAAGDRVPADIRLLEAPDLRADESVLTGESMPVDKSTEAVDAAAVVADRRSMLYLGTTISRGRGLGVVVATGARTELGRVGKLLAGTRSESTPLERRLAAMGRLLVYLVLAIAVVVFVAGLVRGHPPGLMVEVAISLAVAAVPEALPAMTTLILALGVLRMAKERAIVRKLAAVEALGSATVICTDKTGTLTENRMTVVEYQLADGNRITPDSSVVPEELSRLLLVSLLCNDAVLDAADGRGGIGDPTELALIVGARSLNADVAGQRAAHDKVREFPFDAATKRMITVCRDGRSGRTLATLKGGPSVVLAMCTKAAGLPVALDASVRRAILAANDEMANRGLRVLAFAEKELTDEDAGHEGGYTFLGFAGMTDPPRPGVREAVRSAAAAGIRVVMLTGDQVATARAIAKDLNISSGGEVNAMHATAIAGLDRASLAEAASRTDVFARVSPEDKLRIVEALKAAGEVVAVTGDGINDAPALKRSDIGVAMGLRGTEVAKEAADIVLTDDNFATIVKAIEGGRAIYANILRFVHLMFSHNLGEIIAIFVAIIAGMPLPLLPLQILWINIVTDIFPSLALAFEPASKRTMNRAPRSAGDTFISRGFLLLVGWQGILLGATTLAAYGWALSTYGEGSHARTVALLAFVAVQFGHTFNCRSRTRSAFDQFFSNPYLFVAAGMVIALQVAAFTIAPVRELLDLTPPNAADLIAAAFCVVVPVMVVELAKFIGRRSDGE